MVTLSDPDAKLLANVLEQDVEAMLNGERALPTPHGTARLEGIVAKLRDVRNLNAAPSPLPWTIMNGVEKAQSELSEALVAMNSDEGKGSLADIDARTDAVTEARRRLALMQETPERTYIMQGGLVLAYANDKRTAERECETRNRSQQIEI